MTYVVRRGESSIRGVGVEIQTATAQMNLGHDLFLKAVIKTTLEIVEDKSAEATMLQTQQVAPNVWVVPNAPKSWTKIFDVTLLKEWGLAVVTENDGLEGYRNDPDRWPPDHHTYAHQAAIIACLKLHYCAVLYAILCLAGGIVAAIHPPGSPMPAP